MLVTLTASTRAGVKILRVQMENAWLTGQPRTVSYTILRIPLAFSLVVELLEIIQTWFSRVLALTACNWTDVL